MTKSFYTFRLELPPPDKMPMMSIPNAKEEAIFIAPLYENVYCVHHAIGSSGSDELNLYRLSKVGAVQTHCLAVPVSGNVLLSCSDNLLYCHCVESRISVAYDIAATRVEIDGIRIDSPICGASMLRESENDSSTSTDLMIADQPYTGEWSLLYPSYFWDSINRTTWLVCADLEAIGNSTYDPKRCALKANIFFPMPL